MNFIKKFFKIEERGSSIGREIIAGITTFLAMAYILAVNPGMLEISGISFGAALTATAIAAIVGCLIMGILANFPVGQAPGMGMNAFFTFTICIGYGLTFQQAFALVFVSGIIFLIISLTGLRRRVINAIPKNLKLAIGAGIGFFIAFIGLQNAGIIVNDDAVLVSLGSFKNAAMLLSIFGLIVTVILYCLKVKGAILIAIISTTILGIITGQASLPDSIVALPEAPEFFSFIEGFKTMDYSNWPQLLIIIFSLLFIDFFDTAGTLISVGEQAKLVDKKGELINGERALISDATATIVGAMVGTSSTTSYVESLSGVEAGGRTGLTAVVVALGFFIFMFFSPLLSAVGTFATAPALIFVGILMAKQLKDIDWKDIAIAITAFLVIILMPLTYSIAEGIAVGFIFYPIAMICTKRAKEVNVIMYALMVVFIIYFVLTTI